PQTPHPKPQTPNPKPQTPNPKPQTLKPQPKTLHRLAKNADEIEGYYFNSPKMIRRKVPNPQTQPKS
ncbi:hypothetical protein T484DRAFT_1644180, partial [Baffinella frigidus]